MDYKIVQAEETEKHLGKKINDLQKDLAYYEIRKKTADKNYYECLQKIEKYRKMIQQCRQHKLPGV
jgi:hypothetical protein